MFNFILIVILSILLYKAFRRIEHLEGKDSQLSNDTQGNISNKQQDISQLLEHKSNREERIQEMYNDLAPESKNTTPTIKDITNIQSHPESIPNAKQGEAEFSFGTNWITGIGITAVLFGVAFFFKYAFDNNLIGETGRIAIGLLAGTSFLGLGEYLRDTYKKYSTFITGGGFGLLYLSFFFAYQMYHLISGTTAFVALVITTLVAALLALRYDSQDIAGIALLGGYITPFLAGSHDSNILAGYIYLLVLSLGLMALGVFKKWPQIAGFTILGSFATPLLLGMIKGNMHEAYFYTILLALGTLVLSYYRKWRYAVLGSALGSALFMFANLTTNYHKELVWVTFIYITLLGVIYTFTTLASVIRNKASELVSEDLSLMVTIGTVTGLASFAILDQQYHAYIGALPMAYAVFYTFVTLFIKSENVLDKKAILYPMTLAIIALTLVFPAQFEGAGLTLTWLIEALAFGTLGYYLHSQLMQYSIPVWIVSIFSLFSVSDNISYMQTTPIYNERFWLWIIAIAVTTVLTYFFYKRNERNKSVPLGVSAGLGVLALIPMELELARHTHYITSDTSSFLLSALYLIFAGLLLTAGIAWRNANIRIASIALFLLVVAKTFFVDIWTLGELARIISFIVLGFTLLAVGYFYTRHADKIKEFLTEDKKN